MSEEVSSDGLATGDQISAPGTSLVALPEARKLDFSPLGMCPKAFRQRYEARAMRAGAQPMEAIRLKCLECSAWDYPEAKSCVISTCPLWAMNRRAFRVAE